MNWTAIWLAIDSFLEALVYGDKNEATLTIDHTQNTPAMPPKSPQVATLPPTQPKYQWDTKIHIVHSIRVLCDEAGMTLEQKNTMTATIGAESEYKLTAKCINRNQKGVITSIDNGLCQWNSHYHASEITPDEAINNPEKAVRLMIQYWKRGQRDLWIGYKNGNYKRFL